jgi:Fur family ferric uptake transcriptional regulator
LSLAEIHAAAREHVPEIGLRTIYRQLKDMASEGLVAGVDYPGQPLRYERTGSGHRGHFICHSCSKVFALEMEVPDVEVTIPDGYRMTGQETVFYGYCPGCAEGSETVSAG